VIFNRDTNYEDHGPNYSQINEIQKYIMHHDITIDAIYSSSNQSVQQLENVENVKVSKADK